MNANLLKLLRRPLVRLATLLGAFTVLWACNAPFIPVPPPGASFTSALVDDGAGGQKTVWITHGLPSTNAALARSVCSQFFLWLPTTSEWASHPSW